MTLGRFILFRRNTFEQAKCFLKTICFFDRPSQFIKGSNNTDWSASFFGVRMVFATAV